MATALHCAARGSGGDPGACMIRFDVTTTHGSLYVYSWSSGFGREKEKKRKEKKNNVTTRKKGALDHATLLDFSAGRCTKGEETEEER